MKSPQLRPAQAESLTMWSSYRPFVSKHCPTSSKESDADGENHHAALYQRLPSCLGGGAAPRESRLSKVRRSPPKLDCRSRRSPNEDGPSLLRSEKAVDRPSGGPALSLSPKPRGLSPDPAEPPNLNQDVLTLPTSVQPAASLLATREKTLSF